MPQLYARSLELARDGGFVLAEKLADLCERELVDVVVGEAEAIARRECGESGGDTRLHHREIGVALGIGRGGCRFGKFGGPEAIAYGIVQRLGLLRAAKLVDVALRE